MSTNYVEYNEELREQFRQLAFDSQVFSGFSRTADRAFRAGALTPKTKRLMALAIGVATGCEGCIAYYVSDAVEAGATRRELLETLNVAVILGGGVSSVYAAKALQAIEQCLGKASDEEPHLFEDPEEIYAD
jgi:AhpD family alkylhydroperoxidase